MKVLVLAKHVPDTETVVKLSADGHSIQSGDFKYITNPCDDYAIEEAIRLLEKFPGGEGIIVSLGGQNCQDTLRKAMAMGLDRAVWIETPGEVNLDSYQTAFCLAQIVAEEKPDVIFCGLNTTDEGAANVGPMVAEFAGVPSLLNISQLTWKDEKNVIAEREVEGGMVEIYEASTPVLIAPHQNLNEPRFASLPGIMKAKKKPLAQKALASVLQDQKPRVDLIQYLLPPEKPPAKIFKGQPPEEMAKSLVQALRSEAKVV